MAKPDFVSSGKDSWGVSHGAGKGDKPRHDIDRFREGYDQIIWPKKEKINGRFRKVYR